MHTEDIVITVFKGIFITVGGWVTAIYIYFEPVKLMWGALLAAWLANIILGWLVAMLVMGERFKFRKSLTAFVELLLYFAITALLYFIGNQMGDKEFILQALNKATWVFLWVYIVNIFKNLSRAFPASSPICLIFDVISFEILRRLPCLKNLKSNNHDTG